MAVLILAAFRLLAGAEEFAIFVRELRHRALEHKVPGQVPLRTNLQTGTLSTPRPQEFAITGIFIHNFLDVLSIFPALL